MQVETAQGITIRVVSNVMKQGDVDPDFLELFESDQYPKRLPNRQKTIILFQQIDGVDVCLFCFYFQVCLSKRLWIRLRFASGRPYLKLGVFCPAASASGCPFAMQSVLFPRSMASLPPSLPLFFWGFFRG